MFDLINRIRNFDPKKITPTQILIGIIAVIIILSVLNFIIGLANTLLPFAIIALVGYFGYRWLNSREGNQNESTLSKVRDQFNNLTQSNTTTTEATVTEEVTTSEPAVATQPEEATTPAENAEDRLAVQQVVNPETGFKEPDIQRLIEREEEKLAEADRMNDEIMSQIEERRRRLLGKEDSDGS